MVQSINEIKLHQPANAARSRRLQRANTNVLVAAVLAGLLVLGLLLGALYVWKSSHEGGLSGVDASKYQALFLTNGQVYFGKLSQSDTKTVHLHDIYYLQVQQAVQPKPEQATDTTAQNQKLSLAKLGGELHGPEDNMYVDRSQVLFWENLQDKGKVVQAIKDYKNKK